MKIAIVGIGGVGGYFGGLLAQRYAGSKDTEIIFIARGATEKTIRKKGLLLITPEGEKKIFPHQTTSDPKHIGEVEVLICATKSYHLEESLLSLKECIGAQTVIIPLLNGVDASDRIRKIFPGIEVWDACVYIISGIISPGIIRQSGNIHTLYFGSETANRTKLEQLEHLLKDAGIDAVLSEHIQQTIWEKFLFISSLASITSYLDSSVGEILHNETYRSQLQQLIKEVKSLSDAKGILLPEYIIEKTMAKIEALPFETTSSMLRDFRKGTMTEYKTLTEYVITSAKELHVPAPAYEKVLAGLLQRKHKSGMLY